MNAYELLGIARDATSTELDAAYAAKRRAYDPERLTGMGTDVRQHAEMRVAQLDMAYRTLRPALALPPRLAPEVERRRDRETIVALLVFLVLALAGVLLRDVAVPERTAAVGGADTARLTAQVAPDFTLPTLDGKQVTLSDLRGKVVLVNFWATWCPPCVREVPSLVRIYEQYKTQDFVLLGLNTTYQDDPAKVAQFAANNKISFPILLDATGEGGAGYGSRLMPTSYLIDREGRIVYTHVGQVDERNLSERVAALLTASSASEK